MKTHTKWQKKRANVPGVTLCAGIQAEGLTGPFFNEGTATANLKFRKAQ
jgi:hypothetical protein